MSQCHGWLTLHVTYSVVGVRCPDPVCADGRGREQGDAPLRRAARTGDSEGAARDSGSVYEEPQQPEHSEENDTGCEGDDLARRLQQVGDD